VADVQTGDSISVRSESVFAAMQAAHLRVQSQLEAETITERQLRLRLGIRLSGVLVGAGR
jgi:hypothetical protein